MLETISNIYEATIINIDSFIRPTNLKSSRVCASYTKLLGVCGQAYQSTAPDHSSSQIADRCIGKGRKSAIFKCQINEHLGPKFSLISSELAGYKRALSAK